MVGQPAQQALGHGAIGHRIGFACIVEQEWQVEHHEPLVDAGQQARRHRGEVQRAAPHGRQVLRVSAQHGVRVDRHLHLAAAFLGDQVREFLRALAQRMVLRQAECEFQGACLDLLRGHGGAQRQTRQQRRGGSYGKAEQRFPGLHHKPL
ncbi:hypothetical protein D3C71_1308470 [compost metagenome]